MSGINSISKKKQCRHTYARAVFIDFVERHPQMAVTNYPDSFEVELGIANNVTYAKSLAYKRLIQRNGLGGYSVTEEGRKLIDPDYVEFYRFCSPYVDVYEFVREREEHPEENFCVAMWNILLREVRNRMREGDFTAVCNIHRDVALLYEREQCFEQAAYHFAVALYVHYSGLQYYDDMLKLIRGTKSEKTVRGLCSFIYAPPPVVEGIKRHREWMTKDMVQRVFRCNPLAVNLCSPEMYYQLMQDLIAGTYNDEQWQDRLTAAYEKVLENAKRIRASGKVKTVSASRK